MYLGVFAVGLSAGILIYSGYLLVAPGRLNLIQVISEAADGEYGSAIREIYPRFPAEEVRVTAERALDSKMGLLLLVLGTLGTTLSTLIASTAPQTSTGLWLNLMIAAIGCTIGWAVAPPVVHSVWRKWQVPPTVTDSFFVWLERELGAWRVKGWTFTLAIGNTARHSGFQLLDPLIRQCGPDDEALCKQVMLLAYRHRFQWQDTDFQTLAKETAPASRGLFRQLLRFSRG